MACGRCGCKDVHGGSCTPDVCRRCGAVEGPDDWYYDDNSNNFDPTEYDKEHKVDDTIFDMAIKARNEKMFEEMQRSVNTPSFVEHEKETTHLVTLIRHKVRLKPNLTCKDVKRILEKVPDNAVLTIIDVDDLYITELYFDIERIS